MKVMHLSTGNVQVLSPSIYRGIVCFSFSFVLFEIVCARSLWLLVDLIVVLF